MGKHKGRRRDDAIELEVLKRELLKARAKKDFKEISNLHNRIGILYRELSMHEEALEEHEEEIAVTKRHFPNDLLGLGMALRAKSEVYLDMKEEKKALPLVKEYLRLALEASDLVEEQRAHVTLGRVYLALGLRYAEEDQEESKLTNLKKAETEFLLAKDIVSNERTQISNSESMEMKCGVYINLFLVLDCAGREEESLNFLRKAIELAENFFLHNYLFRAHHSFYEVHYRNKRFQQAVTSARDALKAANVLRAPKLQAEAALLQAKANFLQNDIEGGVGVLKKIRKDKIKLTFVEEELTPLLLAGVRIVRTQDKLHSCPAGSRKAKLYEILGDKYVDLGNFVQATINYEEALKNLETHSTGDNDKKKAELLFSLAETLNDMGKFEEAKKVYLSELRFHENRNPSEAFKTQMKLAALVEKGDFFEEEVVEAYRLALTFAKDCNNPAKEVEALSSFANFLKTSNRHVELEKVERELSLHAENPFTEDYSEKTDDSNQSDSGSSIDLNRLTSDDGGISDDPEEHGPRAAVATLKKKFRINEKGETPLHVAAKKGDLKGVRRLLRQGHEVNPRDSAGWIPLHEAANFGHHAVVQELLQNGARINDQPSGPNCDQISPLHDSAANGHTDVVRLFVDNGANVLLKDAKGNYPIDSLFIFFYRTKNQMSTPEIQQMKETIDLLKSKMVSGGKVYSKEQERRAKRKAKEVDGEDRVEPKFLVERRVAIKVALDDFDPDDGDAAVDFYSNTMKGLRGKVKIDSSEDETLESDRHPEALISEDNYVDEDWLDDDLGGVRARSNKRKREFTKTDDSPDLSPRRKRGIGRERGSDSDSNDVILIQESNENEPRKSSRNKTKPSIKFPLTKRPSSSRIRLASTDDEDQDAQQIISLTDSDTEQASSSGRSSVIPAESMEIPFDSETSRHVKSILEKSPPPWSRPLATPALSTSIVFSCPDIRLNDTNALCNYLQCQHSLQEINLSGALILDDGVKSLKGVLPNLKSLVTLDLSLNGLTLVGLNHLREGFSTQQSNYALANLNLNFNPLGKDSGHALTELLALFGNLKKLSLADTDFNSSTIDETLLLPLLAKLQLEELDLRYNHIGDRERQLLLDSGVFTGMEIFNKKKYNS